MRSKYYFGILFVVLFGLSCERNTEIVNHSDTTGELGKVSLSLTNAPPLIRKVIAKLSRPNQRERQLTLTISDSGNYAMGTMNDIPRGEWHLTVEAYDSLDVLRYNGETIVNILPGQTTIVELVLLPINGSIDIRVRWGIENLLLPDNTKWEWTRDARGGGSQSSLVFKNNIVEILPVEYVHFINRTINQASAIYKFKFQGDNFVFAWRVRLTDSTNGTALVLIKDRNGPCSLIHTQWGGYYYGWPNSHEYFWNDLIFEFDPTSWHQVEIHDLNNNLRIYFDGELVDLFTSQKPASDFLVDVGSGGLGIGNDQQSVVLYKDIQVILP